MGTTATIGNQILTTFTVIAQILVVVLFFIYIKDRKNPGSLFRFTAKHGFLIAFTASGIALCGSLFYSEVLGYEPCKFCWWQRIFMYPQVLLLGVGMLKKDFAIVKYSLILSILGTLTSLNHYILQTTSSSIFPCSAIGQSVSCSKVFVMRLGYITIPLMAFSAFALMIVSLLFVRVYGRIQSR